MRLDLARTTGLLTLLAGVIVGQSRFENGDFKGFTRSPTEHIINYYEGRVSARVFEGDVVDASDAPMKDVIVEVRGPGTSTQIMGTATDERGRFKIGRLSAGTYLFKVTRNGFQSVVGKLKIDSAQKDSKPIRITLRFGV